MIVSGCTTINIVKYVDKIYPPTNPEDIKVFQFVPPFQYVKIGEISVEAPIVNLSLTIERLKERVAKMGGEAVILRLQEMKGIVIRLKE